MPIVQGTLSKCFKKLIARLTSRESDRLKILYYVEDKTYKLVTVEEGVKAYHWDCEGEVRLVLDLVRGEIGELGLAHQEELLGGGD